MNDLPMNATLDSRGTILLAEDEPMLRRLTSELLESEGFTVISVSDGCEGIDFCDRNKGRVNLILSDLQMPRASGLDFARYNASSAFLPFIVYSSSYDEFTAQALSHCGIYDYLLKPVSREILTRTIERAILRATLKADSAGQSDPDSSGRIVIRTTLGESSRAGNRILNRIQPFLSPIDARLFAHHVSALVMNAYEHGNLGLNEKLKSELILNGHYEDEIKSRERDCAKTIIIETSTSERSVTTTVSDEGSGFDYKKYLSMTEEAIIDKLSLPNGRGLLMACRYFDTVNFHNGGSSASATRYMDRI